MNACAVVTPSEHRGGRGASLGKVTRNQVVLSSCGFSFSSLKHVSLQTSSQALLINVFKLLYLSSSLGGVIIFTLQESCIFY